MQGKVKYDPDLQFKRRKSKPQNTEDRMERSRTDSSLQALLWRTETRMVLSFMRFRGMDQGPISNGVWKSCT
jgi:hypothetical protein